MVAGITTNSDSSSDPDNNRYIPRRLLVLSYMYNAIAEAMCQWQEGFSSTLRSIDESFRLARTEKTVIDACLATSVKIRSALMTITVQKFWNNDTAYPEVSSLYGRISIIEKKLFRERFEMYGGSYWDYFYYIVSTASLFNCKKYERDMRVFEKIIGDFNQQLLDVLLDVEALVRDHLISTHSSKKSPKKS